MVALAAPSTTKPFCRWRNANQPSRISSRPHPKRLQKSGGVDARFRFYPWWLQVRNSKIFTRSHVGWEMHATRNVSVKARHRLQRCFQGSVVWYFLAEAQCMRSILEYVALRSRPAPCVDLHLSKFAESRTPQSRGAARLACAFALPENSTTSLVINHHQPPVGEVDQRAVIARSPKSHLTTHKWSSR